MSCSNDPEVAASMEYLLDSNEITRDEFNSYFEKLEEISKMLFALIRKLESDKEGQRLHLSSAPGTASAEVQNPRDEGGQIRVRVGARLRQGYGGQARVRTKATTITMI